MIRTTAKIENGDEIKYITMEAPADEIQAAKQEIKEQWVELGGTITWS